MGEGMCKRGGREAFSTPWDLAPDPGERYRVLNPTLGALSPRSGPVQDPVITKERYRVSRMPHPLDTLWDSDKMLPDSHPTETKYDILSSYTSILGDI